MRGRYVYTYPWNFFFFFLVFLAHGMNTVFFCLKSGKGQDETITEIQVNTQSAQNGVYFLQLVKSM